MNPKELIGKIIKDLKNHCELFAEGELESSNALIELETSEVFQIPYFDDIEIKTDEVVSFKHMSIFNDDSILKRLINRWSVDIKIAKRNKLNIKGKK